MLRSEESMDDNEACTPTLPLKMTKTSLSLQDIQALSRLFYAGAFNECLSFAIDLMTAATSSSTDLPGKHIKVLLLIYLRSVYELGVPIEEHWNRAIAVYQSSLVAPEILVVGYDASFLFFY